MSNHNNARLKVAFAVEQRTVTVPIGELEWRESQSGDGSRILTGYAAVYDRETILYSSDRYCFKEKLAYGTFDKVLATSPDVHLNVGHDMTKVIARTGINGIGGLELKSDIHGLRVYARVNPKDPDVQALAAKMDLKIMDQMSFSFRVLASGCKYESTTDEQGYETELRIITEIAELFDVCICAKGAYTQTEASLRTLLANFTEGAETVLEKQRGRSEEVSADGVGAVKLVEHQHHALLMRARTAANKFKKEILK